jgi:hypothetical protein
MLMMANVMWLIPRQSLLMKLMVRFVSIYMACRVTITYFVSLSYDFPESMFGFQMQQFGLIYDFEMMQLPLLMQVGVIHFNFATADHIIIFLVLVHCRLPLCLPSIHHAIH